jgi:GT2 family glycosyltransferase
LLTQADVFINKKTIISLKDSLISNSNYIISAPMLTNSNKIYKNQKKNIKNVKQISVVKNVIAACFLLDVKKIKKIGFFDENFFLYWEDIDLCRRIKNTQYKIILNKELLALHEGSKSSDNNLSMMYLRLSNYKYGEYLYDYKYHKLRIIKTIRQIFQKIIYFLGNVFIFKFKKAFFEIATLVGILKFFIFFLKDNIKFFFFKK